MRAFAAKYKEEHYAPRKSPIISGRAGLAAVFVLCIVILAKNHAPKTGLPKFLGGNTSGGFWGGASAKKVYMFIGPHKTGSSTLRYFLTSSIDREEAQRQGLELDPHFKDLKHYEQYAWIANRRTGPVTQEEKEAYDVFLNYMQEDHGYEKKLVASEIIDFWDEATWRKELGYVDEYEAFVILFLRERYAHVYSLYNQRHKKYSCPAAFGTEYADYTGKFQYFTGEMYDILERLFDQDHTYVLSLEGVKEAGKTIPEVVLCEVIGVCNVGEDSKEVRNVGVRWQTLAARWVLCTWAKYRNIPSPPELAADIPADGQQAIEILSGDLCQYFKCVCKTAREHMEELDDKNLLDKYKEATAPFYERVLYPPQQDLESTVHCRLETGTDKDLLSKFKRMPGNLTKLLDKYATSLT